MPQFWKKHQQKQSHNKNEWQHKHRAQRRRRRDYSQYEAETTSSSSPSMSPPPKQRQKLDSKHQPSTTSSIRSKDVGTQTEIIYTDPEKQYIPREFTHEEIRFYQTFISGIPHTISKEARLRLIASNAELCRFYKKQYGYESTSRTADTKQTQSYINTIMTSPLLNQTFNNSTEASTSAKMDVQDDLFDEFKVI